MYRLIYKAFDNLICIWKALGHAVAHIHITVLLQASHTYHFSYVEQR